MHVVCVGHVTNDQLEDAVSPGGAALYAGLAAAALGAEVTLLTRAGADFVGHHLFEKLHRVHALPAPFTTAFDERYSGGQRLVRLLREADAVDAPVPHSAVVLLCPVAHEVPDAALAARPTRFLAAGLQGWLRSFAADGLATPRSLTDVGRFSGCHLVSCSEEDLAGLGPETLAALRASVPVVAVTDGAAGARLYSGARGWHVAPLPVTAVDATGAGDVFLATLAIELARGTPLLEAAGSAACAGAVAVTGVGVTGLGGLAALPELLERYAHEVRAPAPLTRAG